MLAADDDVPAAGVVAVHDALAAADDAAGGEVGAFDDLHQFARWSTSGLSIELDDGVADFAEVVRRDAGGHADGDALAAVDQQVGELAGQDGGLVRACRRSWAGSRRCRRSRSSSISMAGAVMRASV